MKNIPLEDMRKLFDKSISTVFDETYKNCDSVDIAKIHKVLLVKGITKFYFMVSLKFIEKYLNEMTKNG